MAAGGKWDPSRASDDGQSMASRKAEQVPLLGGGGGAPARQLMDGEHGAIGGAAAAAQGSEPSLDFNYLGSAGIKDRTRKVSDVEELVERFNQSRDFEGQGCCLECAFSCGGIVASLLTLGCYAYCNAVVVKPGDLGVALYTGVPKLLKPGIHYFTKCNAAYCETIRTADDIAVRNLPSTRVEHPAFSIITVKEGQLGGAYNTNGVYVLFEHGMHLLPLCEFSDVHVQWVNQQHSRLGPLTFLRIDEGYIGGTYNQDGEFVKLDKAGKYVLHDKEYRDAQVVRPFPVGAAENRQFDREGAWSVKLGPLTLVTVRGGFNAVVFESGKIKILGEGHYTLDANTVFDKTISMQTHVDIMKPMEITTNDGIRMQVRGQLTWNITCAERAAVNVENPREDIHQQAEVSLSRVCRSYRREDLMPSEGPSVHPSAPPLPSAPRAVPGNQAQEALQSVHERIQHVYREIHEQSMEFISVIAESWGIKVGSIDIESFTILDREVTQNINKIALSRIEAQAAEAIRNKEIADREAAKKVTILDSQARATDIEQTAAAERQAASERAEAEACKVLKQAETLQTTVEAETNAVRRRADADNDVVRTRAEARAFETMTLAKAEADAQRLKAEAQAESFRSIGEAVAGSGQDAMKFELARGYIAEYGKLAGSSNTMIIQDDPNDVGAFVGKALGISSAMQKHGAGR